MALEKPSGGGFSATHLKTVNNQLCALFNHAVRVSVNIFFTIFTNVFSPIAPTRMRRIRQRGCAAFGV